MRRETTWLTWAALLARWTDFAKAAVALPKTEAGERWRAVVPDIIALQAHVHALGEVRFLAEEERPLALDRAEYAIRQHTSAITAAWQAEPLPELLWDLIGDARAALTAAGEMGTAWIVAGQPGTAVEMPAIETVLAELAGVTPALTVLAAAAGMPMFAGAPLVQAIGVAADRAEVVEAVSAALGGVVEPRASRRRVQVYRAMDPAAGRVDRDLIVPMDETLPAGRPLLEVRVDSGEVMPSVSGDAARVAAAHRAALGEHVPEVIEPEIDWLEPPAEDEDRPGGA